jgi:hypothetical protein
VIQKYYRRWLAKRYVEKVRTDQDRRVEWERAEELRKKKEKEDRIRREFERRMNPKTKEDFDLLYHALESKCTQNCLVELFGFANENCLKYCKTWCRCTFTFILQSLIIFVFISIPTGKKYLPILLNNHLLLDRMEAGRDEYHQRDTYWSREEGRVMSTT